MSRPPGWSLTATPEQLLEQLGIGRTKQRSALRIAGEVLRAKWVETLSGRGKGRIYEAGTLFVTWGGRTFALQENSGVRRSQKVKALQNGKVRTGRHQASLPGDAPARDTGASAASIGIDDGNADALRVGTSLRSLLAQEYGVNTPESKVGLHPGGIVIQPRPHAHRSLEAAREQMKEQVRRVLKRG